jgi:hypothetical protein
MATPNLSEVITSTLRYRAPEVADNVSKNTALLLKLKKKGNASPVGGGRTLVQPLEYAENGTFMYYSGLDLLDVSASDVLTAAEFDWKQAAVSVTISGLEGRVMNAGKEAIIDLLKTRVKNAEKTMINNISTGVYSDGTGSGSKQIGGLQLLVADSPSTGTVGGINRATYSFWRNISADATTDYGAAVTSALIQSYMNRIYVQLVRGTDRPDLIVADNNYWRAYLESLQSIQRITSDEMGQAGFQSLKYMDADVVLDGGAGPGACPTNHMYFLNTDYLYFRPHKETNMIVLGERESVNQDASVRILAWAGNLTISNCALQGVLKD